MKRAQLDFATDLVRHGISFVVATVIRCDEPGEPGVPGVGEAVLWTAQGGLHDQLDERLDPALRRALVAEAVAALGERKPRLARLARPLPLPSPSPSPSLSSLPSGAVADGAAVARGVVELYLEPVIAAPRLLLVGACALLDALAALAGVLGYHIERWDSSGTLPAPQAAQPRAGDARAFAAQAPLTAVLALRHDGGAAEDVASLAAVLARAPVYVGVVASRRRFALAREALQRRGLGAQLERVANPAGLPLGAHDVGELAVGILAQLIARRHGVLAVDESAVSVGEGNVVTSTIELRGDGAARCERVDAFTELVHHGAAARDRQARHDASATDDASAVDDASADDASAVDDANADDANADDASAVDDASRGNDGGDASVRHARSDAVTDVVAAHGAAAVTADLDGQETDQTDVTGAGACGAAGPAGAPGEGLGDVVDDLLGDATAHPSAPQRDAAAALAGPRRWGEGEVPAARASGPAAQAQRFAAPPGEQRPGTTSARERLATPTLGGSGAATVGAVLLSPDSLSPSGVPVSAAAATDPVCQRDLETADARFLGSWDGDTWYFCSAACKHKFFANPLRYSAFARPPR
jgi:xanthine dehydrogenase accessory factor